jgi:hypothetical protein
MMPPAAPELAATEIAQVRVLFPDVPGAAAAKFTRR